MRPPIINHQDYWNTRQTIERLEDAKSRNLLEEETISRDGHIIAGTKEYLDDLRRSVKDYEKKHPEKGYYFGKVAYVALWIILLALVYLELTK